MTHIVDFETTTTVTTNNTPAEALFRILHNKFPQMNPLSEKAERWHKDRDQLSQELQATRTALTRAEEDRDAISAEIEQGIADHDTRLDKELNRVRKALERERALTKNLEAANEAILAADSRPALPEGMRIADHEEYGRVVVSPGTNANGYYMFFTSVDSTAPKAAYWYAKPSELTFLEEEPAPLPKPEDCKAGELYLARAFGREVVATRCDPKDDRFPWYASKTDGNYSGWFEDSDITLLARLLPDREVQA